MRNGHLAVLAIGGYLFGGTIFRIATNQGELIVEVDGTDMEVSVKQGGVVVEDRKKERKFVLTAKGGEVEFFDPVTGVRLLTKEFTLERGGVTVVRAREEFAAARKLPVVKPVPLADPAEQAKIDRQAAGWVLSVGGSVRVNEQARDFGAAAECFRTSWRARVGRVASCASATW